MVFTNYGSLTNLISYIIHLLRTITLYGDVTLMVALGWIIIVSFSVMIIKPLIRSGSK